MKFTPKRALGEFASTFKEWHYFVGGASLGFVAGFLTALYFAYHTIKGASDSHSRVGSTDHSHDE